MNNVELERRLARMESRIVQIMLHLGIDPYKKMYDKFDKPDEPLQPKKKGDNIHT